MTIGTEHEYSINDEKFNPLPDSDKIIRSICGDFESEIPFGDVKIGKELQKTVLEFIPREPVTDIRLLEKQLVHGIHRFYSYFPKPKPYYLLGLGMHPTLTLDQTSVWDHDEGEYYETYDRLFNIRQHGWLNIQALQINLSYSSETELVTIYNKLRLILPYLIAVTASSPMVEGKITGTADNRLLYYRENQKEIPLICNRIIPEKIHDVADYTAVQDKVFSELRSQGADILCGEWVNSSGLIIRFSRKCIEIKALDEQESIHSDMAVCAFMQALLRCPESKIFDTQEGLLEITETAIKCGTENLTHELDRLYLLAWEHATLVEKLYLPIIENRIKRGNLSELIRDRFEHTGEITPILHDMAACLRENTSYIV